MRGFMAAWRGMVGLATALLGPPAVDALWCTGADDGGHGWPTASLGFFVPWHFARIQTVQPEEHSPESSGDTSWVKKRRASESLRSICRGGLSERTVLSDGAEMRSKKTKRKESICTGAEMRQRRRGNARRKRRRVHGSRFSSQGANIPELHFDDLHLQSGDGAPLDGTQRNTGAIS
ncbi:hypothetical protein FB451DRAFT_1186352 [Mycena latifolia]|nr:hypothetical protein FB451DRAFT_1186352 [Mycena latifolia]